MVEVKPEYSEWHKLISKQQKC